MLLKEHWWWLFDRGKNIHKLWVEVMKFQEDIYGIYFTSSDYCINSLSFNIWIYNCYALLLAINMYIQSNKVSEFLEQKNSKLSKFPNNTNFKTSKSNIFKTSCRQRF